MLFKDDFINSTKKISSAFFFAWSDTRARYNGSTLGPFWLVLTTLIFCVGLGAVWSAIFSLDYKNFIPKLTIGIVLWQFISESLSESPANFLQYRNIIKNIKTPYFFFCYLLLSRKLINLAHNLTVVLFVFIVLQPIAFELSMLMVIPGFLILIFNLLWVIMLIGLLGSRLQDLDQLLKAVMPMLFFLSPVIFTTDQLGMKEYLVWFNPLTYFISIVRDPVFGAIPSLNVYLISLLMGLVGWFITIIFFNRKAERLAYWI